MKRGGNVKIFQVGGSVRDGIMGIPHKDRDFVVVGATEQEFRSRFPSAFRVGKSFPVFMVDGEEYAFARVERKVAPGHRGFETVFDPSVTIEEDLKRRDLTINAMAIDPESGKLIDPYGGREDLEKKILRHVSAAFSEDPLRVYRVAQFAARFPGFSVHPETVKTMKECEGELETLSPERVWSELFKALSSPAPKRFFEVLEDAELLAVHFPEILRLRTVPPGPERFHSGESDTLDHTFSVIERLRVKSPLLVFAALCHDLGKGLTPEDNYPHHYRHDHLGVNPVKTLCSRIKAPNSFRDAGLFATELHMRAAALHLMKPKKAIPLLKKLQRFPGGGIEGFLELVLSDSRGERLHLFDLVEKVKPALDTPLPEKYRGLGKKCGEILFMLQIREYKRLISEDKNG